MKTNIKESIAKAIAWTELTDKGRKQCKWPDDFGLDERIKYRKMASAAIKVKK